jgi:hypothetical protein
MEERIELYGLNGESLPYEYGMEHLVNNYEELERFILAVEKQVRADVRYSSYLAAVHEADILRCAVLGKLPDTMKVEMHHGPMWTLYDVCEIVVRDCMARGLHFTTFTIADLVLIEHEENNVMIVGLSETPHKAWHMGKIFVHAKSAWGSVENFIDRYPLGIQKSHIAKAKLFKQLCDEQEGSNDNGLFEMGNRLKLKNLKRGA